MKRRKQVGKGQNNGGPNSIRRSSGKRQTTNVQDGGSILDGPSNQRSRSAASRESKEHHEGQPDAEMADADADDPISKTLNATPRNHNEHQNEGRDDGILNGTPHKDTPGKVLFATPAKINGKSEWSGTPRIQRSSNRSAKMKSTRSWIERTIMGTTSDNDEEEEDIARHIYESEDDPGDVEGVVEPATAPDTPSRKVGRPKGSKNRRSPTPPLASNLPHELYFFQNRGGRPKTSNNNLSSLKLLDHEEYFNVSRQMKDHHAEIYKELESRYSACFNQWYFELEEDFNICVYGWGSKRQLLLKFAEYVYGMKTDHSTSKIVIVNGYVSTLTIRDVLNTVTMAISEPGHRLGSQPQEMLDNLVVLLESDKTQDVTLIIHSIDRIPLRRPATQTILSRLSSHPQVHLVASADHPSFPLLWDSSLRSDYNFLFHECATFQEYSTEIDVVDEVHELLGRSGRRVGGKEGVIFVLKSLPENAKNLFRVLIGEQLAAMEDTSAAPLEDDDKEHGEDQQVGRARGGEFGVEYRVLYQKAVEEFICSNEMNLRTLLKEFHDHQMIQSKKDSLGTEYLSVPFRKEELETILEDLSS